MSVQGLLDEGPLINIFNDNLVLYRNISKTRYLDYFVQHIYLVYVLLKCLGCKDVYRSIIDVYYKIQCGVVFLPLKSIHKNTSLLLY